MPEFWTADKLISLVVAAGTIISILFGPGILGPMVNTYLYPKYTLYEKTIPVRTGTDYDNCVIWQKGQRYRVDISTSGGTPVLFQITGPENYTLIQKGQHNWNNVMIEQLVYSLSLEYTAPEDGHYFITLSNPNWSVHNSTLFQDRIVIANISVEAYSPCEGKWQAV